MSDNEPCTDCGHPMDPHVLVTTGDTPFEGGIMFCPECDCWSTWALPQLGGTRETVRIPDEAERAQLRKLVLG